MLKIIIIITVVIFGIDNAHVGGNWGYHSRMSFKSPDQWKDLHKTSCGGNQQSPINIVTKRGIYKKELKPLKVERKGKSADVKLEVSSTSMYLSFSHHWIFSLGGKGCWKPIAIHWHWGLSDRRGSEHTIDGIQYVMEGHLVTYNCLLYKSRDEAIHSVNGLHVFAILYKIGEKNPALADLEPYMNLAINKKEATLSEISPRKFLPENLNEYYQYHGSLTTPPCTENVLWTVYNEIQTICKKQLQKFRTLQYGPPETGAMGDNFRPVVSSSTRNVFTSFKVDD